MRFNVNNDVRIKLTPFGREVLRLDHDKFWAQFGRIEPYIAPKEDDEGWSKWQLWHLIQAFGPHIMVGASHLPFETEIDLILQPSAKPSETK